MKKINVPGKVYLVGGAVRDRLLGLEIREHDYVVVGATPELMSQAGFTPVGQTFPVFLHPKTHEEYALARTERKIARGHQGFNFYTDPTISLEQDLARRDLSINAMAASDAGDIIDPFNGKADLQARILRHVGPAFVEDPLRVFRVARFAAYLGQFGFEIAPETLTLMREMVEAGVIAELSDERIWQELAKALNSTHPQLFFMTLKAINALPYLLPSLTEKGWLALMQGRGLQAYTSRLGFALIAHEGPYLKKLPKDFEDLQTLTMRSYQSFAEFEVLNSVEKLKFLHRLDFLRRPERLQEFLQAALLITDKQESFVAVEAMISRLVNLDRGALAGQAKKEGRHIPEYIFEAELGVL